MAEGWKLVHMIAPSGKAGVGKSFAASMLAQRLEDLGLGPLCLDVDGAHSTLSGYSGLNVRPVIVTTTSSGKRNGNTVRDVDIGRFDDVVEEIADVVSEEAIQSVVVDIGASISVQMRAYLLKYGVPRLLRKIHAEIVAHVVIVGGESIESHLDGLLELLESKAFQDVPFVIWLNPYFGAIEYDGARFEDLAVFREHQERYLGLVYMPAMDELTHKTAHRHMLAERLTFSELLEEGRLKLMERGRLNALREEMFRAIDVINLADLHTGVKQRTDALHSEQDTNG